MKVFLFAIVGIIIITIVAIWYADSSVSRVAGDRVFDKTSELKFNKVGLLLGTSKFLSDGRRNLYYLYRIKATVELFQAKKIAFIVISGDNSTHNYNEPKTMKNDLIEAGLPENKIYLDYAGFRTYDSVIRLNKIFGQSSFTVISQRFHNERAIFIAKYKHLDAIGYNAKDVSLQIGLKTQLREKFARVKLFWDLVFGAEPKFLGESIEIK